MTEKENPAPEQLARFCAECALEKSAEEVKMLNVGAQSSVADCFVIGTANSDPHLRALAGFIEREVRDRFGLRPLGVAGESASGWILLDFGTVIVHIMTLEMRQRYNLEGLWGTADCVEEIRTVEAMAGRQ